jgi:hypothetical protein
MAAKKDAAPRRRVSQVGLSRADQLAACAGMSRWCFMTILLSAPR